ncbi:MAG: DNA recombination/repair protein RecA, partial [Moorea sp. SIO3I7]|nr:DNA recombination/repair protein RecA [Moorena sp. SIO3I7]
GGNALKFYASVRLDIRRIQTLKKSNEGEYGIRAKVKVAKNKVAPPFRIAEFDIIFGQGISRLGCLVDLAEQTKVILRKGAWYSHNGDNIAQGRDNTVKYLVEHPEFAENIEQQVRQQLDMGAVVSANSVAPMDSKEADSLEAGDEEA